MKFCYLILHYKNIKDTVKCIDSIRLTAPESMIVIVDNGSGDGTGRELREKYENELCHVIIEEENLGFSKGNNAGYSWIKDNLDVDYIIISNNDVVFYQQDFEKRIEQIYSEEHFFVLGPDVYIPRHKDHQSPIFLKAITAEELESELEQYRYYEAHPEKFNRRLKLHAFKNMLCSNVRLIGRIYSRIRKKDSIDYRKKYINAGLQGSCLIFSGDFVEKEDKAFDPEPFLYEEEVFLYCRCMEKGYKMVYSPEIAIRHEEAASFNNSGGSNDEKLRFMLRHHVSAREMLLEYLLSSKERKKSDV